MLLVLLLLIVLAHCDGVVAELDPAAVLTCCFAAVDDDDRVTHVAALGGEDYTSKVESVDSVVSLLRLPQSSTDLTLVFMTNVHLQCFDGPETTTVWATTAAEFSDYAQCSPPTTTMPTLAVVVNEAELGARPLSRRWTVTIPLLHDQMALTTTKYPTRFPTRFPTTRRPTTRRPTLQPTTLAPTKRATLAPSRRPDATLYPSRLPTSQAPTRLPTRPPTKWPTTRQPTKWPTTARPTKWPTTAWPTKRPTKWPTSRAPTKRPTKWPTTARPTKRPTRFPATIRPTKRPTAKTMATTMPSSRQPTRYPTTPANSAKFNIKLLYVSPVSQEIHAVFNAAKKRWSDILSRSFASSATLKAGTYCGYTLDTNITIQDVEIAVFIHEIDGLFNTIGSAGPCLVDDLNRSRFASMELDIADVEYMLNAGTLANAVLHEMAHALGFFTLREDQLVDFSRVMPGPVGGYEYLGPYGNLGNEQVGRTGSAIVEDTGGRGTARGHWKESVYGNELMTGFVEDGRMPLSRLTLQAMRDLGYDHVDLSKADAYTAPDEATLALREQQSKSTSRVAMVGCGEHKHKIGVVDSVAAKPGRKAEFVEEQKRAAAVAAKRGP